MDQLAIIDARDGFAPQPRGWGRYARCLVEALKGLSPDQLQPLELSFITSGGGRAEVVFEQLRLPMLLRRRGAVLVHATNCFLPLIRPCPGVATVHDLAFEEWPDDFHPLTGFKYRILASRAARSAERVICPSAFTRDDVCSRYGVDPDRVRVIPEAPAMPIGDADPPDAPYVLAVGDLRQKKNLSALVSVHARLWHEGATGHRLVLAGVDSGEGPRLRTLAGPAPLELPGYVSDERLDALIRGAEVLVHPSLYEGFGLVVLEAMARGTPVLAARAGALPETGGDAAAYFDPADPDSLADRLASLLADDAARARLSEAGRAWAARFSWQGTAAETAAVYRELL
ncbi:MAG: glycosyltransferase family 4 protein [Solirubrobacteraceae bacterium]